MIDTKNWTIHGVYQLALNKQYLGAVFHHDGSLLMRYLYFPHMARIQEERYKEEIFKACMIERCYLSRYHKVISPTMTERIEVITSSILSTNSCEVSNTDRRKVVYEFMEKWEDWEKEVEEYLTVMSDWCTQNECGGDAFTFSQLLEGVFKERKRVFELKSQLKIHDWSVDFIDKVAKHSDS